MKDIETARSAIIADLKRRGDSKDFQTMRVVNEDNTYFYIGDGQIDCPVCREGKLRYGRASNGHVHASCSTEGCVRWMER